jgi:acyl carrier protein
MAKTSEQVLADLNLIFRRVLNNDAVALKYETTAQDVKDWDSLNHIELVLAVEKHFKIRFNFSELQKFKNVGQWCENIMAKLAGTSAPV